MAKLRKDYSVRSANVPVKAALSQYRANRDLNMYRGMIYRVYYTDDPENTTSGSQNPQVVYDVILTSGPLEGQILTNVKTASSLGGQFNFEEIVFRKASRPFSGQLRVPLNQQDGDVVYIQFVCGNLSSPVIVGAGAHPLDVTNTGATSEDGPRRVVEYNGVNTLIDKNGNWILTRKGGAYDDVADYFTPNARDTIEAQIQLLHNQINRNVGAGTITEAMDGNAQKYTLMMKNGLTITFDGQGDQVTIVTKGGATLTIDGNAGTIKAVDNAGGTLKISGGKVGLGASSAEVVNLIYQLAQALATDLGNLGYPLVNQATYQQIASLAQGIEGGI